MLGAAAAPWVVVLWDVVTLWGGALRLSPCGTPEGHLMGWHLMGPQSIALWGGTLWGVVTLWDVTLQLSPSEIPVCHPMRCHPMACHHMGPLIVTLWGITLWGGTLHLSHYGTPEHCPMGSHLMGWHPPIVTLWVP